MIRKRSLFQHTDHAEDHKSENRSAMARGPRRGTHRAVGDGTQKRVEGNSQFGRGAQGNCGFKRRSFDQPGGQGRPIRNDESGCEVYMLWSSQQACPSGTVAQDCVVRIRRADRIFTEAGESRFLTDHNNIKDAAITLRPAATNGTFRIEIVVGLAQDIRKDSIELKGNQCL